MEIRNVSQIEPIIEHGGTGHAWVLFEGARDKLGGGIEIVNEFEVRGGETLEFHAHNTEEFYYILYGRGEMTVDGETEDVCPGDLIHIPPGALHSIKPKGKHYPIHVFCFAVSVKG